MYIFCFFYTSPIPRDLSTSRIPSSACKKTLVNSVASLILFEKSLHAQDFFHAVMNVIHDKTELEKMSAASKKLGRPDATKEIVNHIFEAAA